MKPIIAMTSLALGSASMSTLVYLASNPNAFLSSLPAAHGDTEARVQVPIPSKAEESEVPRATQVAPIRTKARIATRPQQPANIDISGHIQPVNFDPTATTSEEPTLTACSDWRSVGPSFIESGVGSGEHQVKLLCPSGANAQDTFMADMQLHPTKMRLNDLSQMRDE